MTVLCSSVDGGAVLITADSGPAFEDSGGVQHRRNIIVPTVTNTQVGPPLPPPLLTPQSYTFLSQSQQSLQTSLHHLDSTLSWGCVSWGYVFYLYCTTGGYNLGPFDEFTYGYWML